MNSKRAHIIVLALTIVSGAWLRLHALGIAAFRSDTILVHSLAVRAVPPIDIFTRWFEVSGAAGQMPFPAFVMQLFLRTFDLPPTPFNVRLPFALLGILTIPAAYWAGRQMSRSPVAGLLMAAYVAWHPFAIQLSQEAYFYASGILGYVMYFGALFRLVNRQLRNEAFIFSDLMWLAGGLFLSAYSQVTAIVLYLPGFIILSSLMLKGFRKPFFKVNALKLALVHAVVMLPVSVASWGYLPILKQIGGNREYGKSVVELAGINPAHQIASAIAHFGWGTTPLAVLLLILALAGATAALFKRETRLVPIVSLTLIALQIIVFSLARVAAGALYEARYLSGIFPCIAALVITGFFLLPTLMLDRFRRPLLTAAPAFLAIGWFIYPGFFASTITGKPVPYFEIVRWCDSNLPQGAPVVVDRWFEPWNEFVSHPSTNTHITFTLPNEPLETFRQFNWREATRRFFETNPDAAYLEIAKTYFNVPDIGPWHWPREFFRRHVAFTNASGLKLRELGLAARGDYYAADTNRVVVELFYNTREDVVEILRQQGTRTHAFFGPGWAFEKSGPMGFMRIKTQDFRDWRVLSESGTLELANLTDKPLMAKVRIRGLAAGGVKQVIAADKHARNFDSAAIQTWDFGPFELAPGVTSIRLQDRLWERTHVPLLVEQVELIEER